MKTRNYFRIIPAVLGLLFAGTSYGQVATKIDTLPTVYIYSHSPVTKTVHEAFKKDFKDAVLTRWFVMHQNFLVKFISKDQRNHALYNKKGAIIYHIAYGDEKTLPGDVLAVVKEEYPACDVVTCIYVKQGQRNVWVVNVKEKGDLVKARVENDQLEEVERVQDQGL